MVGAADVTNGVRERRSSSGERGDGRETKVIVSVIETSKGSSLEDLGEGGCLANGKRGTSAYGVADTGERKGLPGEKAKEENQRQGNVELQKKGSSILFMEVMTPGLIQLELSQIVLL